MASGGPINGNSNSNSNSNYGERPVNALRRGQAPNEEELAAIKKLEAIIRRKPLPTYIKDLMYASLFSNLGKGEEFVKQFVMEAIRNVGTAATILNQEEAANKIEGLAPFGKEFMDKGMYDAAILIYYRILNIQELFFPRKQHMSYIILGDNFTLLRRFDEALEFYRDALRFIDSPDPSPNLIRRKGRLLTKIAGAYLFLGRTGAAREAVIAADNYYSEHEEITNNNSRRFLENTRGRLPLMARAEGGRRRNKHKKTKKAYRKNRNKSHKRKN